MPTLKNMKKNPLPEWAVWPALVLMLGASACSSTPTRLVSSPAIPSAQGTVTTSAEDNQNTRVEVEVRHLAQPARVQSGATTYVLWAEPFPGGAPTNLGALEVDDNLSGKIVALTPMKDFRLYITAEPSGMASSPQGRRVLWAEIAPKG